MNEEQKNEQPQVLVADDDPAILRLVKAIVEKEGYTVVSARDGKEAYKLLQSGEPFRRGDFRCRDAVYSRHGAGALYAVGKTSDENSGDYDDGGTKSASFVGKFFGGRGRFFAETFYRLATADDAANVRAKKLCPV
jgi:CheY-like chemotaxis protein